MRESGRTIWKEFQGYEWQEDTKTYVENAENKAEWNQDMLAYEYINAEYDEGHPVFWIPQMGIEEIYDEEKGMANFCQTFQTLDYVLGKSGLKIDQYISVSHPYLKFWQILPNELASKYYAEMYAEAFPEFNNGRHLIVKWIEEDVTSPEGIVSADRDTFFENGQAKLTNEFNTGITQVSKNTYMITMSLVHNKELGLNTIIAPQIALMDTLNINNKYIFDWDDSIRNKTLITDTFI